MVKFSISILLIGLISCNFSTAQSIFIGGAGGVNLCYLGGRQINHFHDNILQVIKHTYHPGFYLGLNTDYYPLKAKKQIFLISINIGYQQYSQSILWSGKGDSIFNYNQYRYYESKINRELYYSLQMGAYVKGFAFKTGLTFMQTIANSGQANVYVNNIEYLNTGNIKWPSYIYKSTFGHEELLAIPINFSYNIFLTSNIYISLEALVEIGVVGVNYIDFSYYGNTWGRIDKTSLGFTIHYSLLKK